MAKIEPVWIGADPGGKGKFGVATLFSDGNSWTGSVDCADEAVEAVMEQLAKRPNGKAMGAGIDSPLWWSSGPSSARKADEWLRRTYGLSGGEVQCANSLRGAALVQSLMFIERLRARRNELPVTETHPKALMKALGFVEWSAFGEHFEVSSRVTREDERDALISAIAAREGFEGHWPLDLSIERYAEEQDPKAYWLKPVWYYWPDKLSESCQKKQAESRAYKF